jgi:hypothetical protein
MCAAGRHRSCNGTGNCRDKKQLGRGRPDSHRHRQTPPPSRKRLPGIWLLRFSRYRQRKRDAAGPAASTSTGFCGTATDVIHSDGQTALTLVPSHADSCQLSVPAIAVIHAPAWSRDHGRSVGHSMPRVGHQGETNRCQVHACLCSALEMSFLPPEKRFHRQAHAYYRMSDDQRSHARP